MASAASSAARSRSGLSIAGTGSPARTATAVCTLPMSLAELASTCPCRTSSPMMAEVSSTRSAGAPASSSSRMPPTAPKVPAMLQPVSASKRGASASTRPCAAPPLKSLSCMVASGHGGDDALARDRQITHAHAQGVENGVADGGHRRAVRRLPGTKRSFVRASDDLDLDRGHLRERQDRIGLPAVAGDVRAIETYRLEQRPAGGLDCSTLDLVGNS